MNGMIKYFGEDGVFQPSTNRKENNMSKTSMKNKENKRKVKVNADVNEEQSTEIQPTETALLCRGCKYHRTNPSFCRVTNKYVPKNGTCTKWEKK